jgi:hypothetical protein
MVSCSWCSHSRFARTEVEEDVRRLGQDQAARLEERGREHLVPLHRGEHALDAIRSARDVDIFGAGVFQRQADEFAAPLDAGPVEQLVRHRGHFRLIG